MPCHWVKNVHVNKLSGIYQLTIRANCNVANWQKRYKYQYSANDMCSIKYMVYKGRMLVRIIKCAKTECSSSKCEILEARRRRSKNEYTGHC